MGDGYRSLLGRIDEAAPVDAIEVAEAELVDVVGARDVSLLICDYSGRAVVRFDRSSWARAGVRRHDDETAETIRLAGTAYERVLRTQQIDVEPDDRGAVVRAPVTVRGDAIGVLELRVPQPPVPAVLTEVAEVAHAFGYVVVANRRYTDLFEWGQRTVPFTLAAEIQRRLLPGAFSCDADEFSLAGWLEPAATVGGDTFDYALDRETLHLSITDAVGNDVNAALLATVLVSSLRNGRRRGLDLLDQVRSANEALAAHSPTGAFVTGQAIRVDLDTGVVTLVNAGHPFPILLRGGEVREVELHIDIPFGIHPDHRFALQTVELQPGDRILFVTDGVLDRNSAHVDVPAVLGRTLDHHPREVVRELSDAVIAATGGDLKDDSTVLCLDWRGPGHPAG
jgi:serine phosphatase RsbU (regulator of sigma subunit)